MDDNNDISKVQVKVERQVVSDLKAADRVATGYYNLDEMLCGGLPPNFAVVLTSPSCDERDLLIKSFLETGQKNGEATFYVTIDPRLAIDLTGKAPSTFYLFVCNPQADALVKTPSPNIFKVNGVESLTNISIALTSAIRKLDPSLKGNRRMCIDIVSDVLLQHHSVQTRKWLTELIAQLKSTNFTTLAVIDPQMHPSEELHAILGLFEGEIDICDRQTEKGLERFLKIKRMSNQKYIKNETLLVVTVTLGAPSKVFNIRDFAAFLAKRGIKAFDPISGVMRLGSQEIYITEDGAVEGPEFLKLRTEKWIAEFMSR
ncbi:MAG: ATPase domain-containing protein [Candidatus Bathyarchaeia archaeon]|jgi:KaiC/GvpD/RAD55 family RecA-like ATPase